MWLADRDLRALEKVYLMKWPVSLYYVVKITDLTLEHFHRLSVDLLHTVAAVRFAPPELFFKTVFLNPCEHIFKRIYIQINFPMWSLPLLKLFIMLCFNDFQWNSVLMYLMLFDWRTWTSGLWWWFGCFGAVLVVPILLWKLTYQSADCQAPF